MPRLSPFTAAAALAGLALAGAAGAQTVDAGRPNAVADMMRGYGMTATIETDSYGDPLIRAEAIGVSFFVLFYGCEDGMACKDLEFSAGFDLADPISSDSVNSWNRQVLSGHAWIDEDGDPYLEMFLPGVLDQTPEAFARALSYWETALSDFATFIDW